MLFLSGALFLNDASYFVHFGGHFMHITSVIFPPLPLRGSSQNPAWQPPKTLRIPRVSGMRC